MRKLIQLVARMPVTVTVVASAFLWTAPVSAQDVPSKPAKKAPAKPAKKAPAKPAKKAPAKPAKKAPAKPAKKAPAKPAKKAPAKPAKKAPRASGESASGKKAGPKAFAQPPHVEPPQVEPPHVEPPEMVPSELEEPEMTGAPESLEKENARTEAPAKKSLGGSPRVRRARLGAVVEPAVLPKALAALGVKTGIRVKELIEGTPAQLDGMLVGDIITRIEGKPIARATDAVSALSGHKPGRVAVVQVLRDGKPILLRLRLDQGTQVVKPSDVKRQRRNLIRRHQIRMQRRNIRQWRYDLRRRHRMRMRQLYRRRY